MELKSLSSSYVSTSEIVQVGRPYSIVPLNFRAVKVSRQFNCFRGSILMTNLGDKAVINAVGPDNLAAEMSFHHHNGINGSTWSLCSRNLKVLDAFDDMYEGVIIDSDQLPESPSIFAPILRFSISHWKKMEGFQYHHAEPGYVMLTYWIPEGPCLLPVNASHQVGVGGFVINNSNEVLVVQEKLSSPAIHGLWKIPTGFIFQSEEIYTGAIREVKEETGIDTEFIEVIAFRHAHDVAFGKSDLFFICMLRPLSSEYTVDDLEIKAAKWMPLVEFVEQPLIQEDHRYLHCLSREALLWHICSSDGFQV